MPPRRFRPCASPLARAVRAPALVALLLALAGPGAQAQHAGHAHVHGRLQLDVAVDDGLLTLRLDSPLDNLLGFERAPRTDDERRRVRQARDRLSDPAALFAIDPAAGCRPAGGEWAAPVLGDSAAPSAPDAAPTRPASARGAAAADRRGRGPAPGQAPGPAEDRPPAHGDLQARYTFRCADAARARFIDLPLFDAFPRLRTVAAQVAAPQGQFQRDVARPARRLAWGR